MSDPIAEAAAQQQNEPSLLEQAKQTIHALEEKVENLMHPDAPEVAQAGEQTQETDSSPSTNSAPAQTDSSTESAPTSESTEPSSSELSGTPSSLEPASTESAEHPHTSILRRMTETLRRKWNVFDGELEAILKDAESHL